MSKNKSKVVKWEYVTESFDVKVSPALFTRLHSPLTPWLSSLTENCYVHLRPCVQGVDEDGAVVKYLYCTRNGRFFVRGKEGWNEILPNTASGKKGHSDHRGTTGCPRMRDYGAKPAHRCVAVAWCNPPEYVKATINDKNAKRIYEVDHLNTDHKNWTADNLQWVTADENRQRGKIACRMRKIGLDPKHLTPTLCRGIYTLPEENDWVGIFFSIFLDVCGHDPSPLSTDAIRLDVAKVLDVLKEHINAGKKLPLVATYEQLKLLLL